MDFLSQLVFDCALASRAAYFFFFFFPRSAFDIKSLRPSENKKCRLQRGGMDRLGPVGSSGCSHGYA